MKRYRRHVLVARGRGLLYVQDAMAPVKSPVFFGDKTSALLVMETAGGYVTHVMEVGKIKSGIDRVRERLEREKCKYH